MIGKRTNLLALTHVVFLALFSGQTEAVKMLRRHDRESLTTEEIVKEETINSEGGADSMRDLGNAYNMYGYGYGQKIGKRGNKNKRKKTGKRGKKKAEANFRRCRKLPGETYDYIVVGSGAGGGVLASRLAEAGFSTLLLDAGPDYDGPDTQVPTLWPLSTINPEIEWAFRVKTTDDPGRNDVLYPRSSSIGGCTIHNAMHATYPYPDTFDALAELTGDSNWSEEKMRNRFIKIEKNEYGQGSLDGHGLDGFLSTSFLDPRLLAEFEDPQLINLLGAFVQTFPAPDFPPTLLGKIIPDINSPGLNCVEGSHFTPNAISPSDNYRRSGVYKLIKDTAAGYYSKLTVKPNSFVTKVLLKEINHYNYRMAGKETAIAYGVKVREGKSLYDASTGEKYVGREKLYFARKEVIISGGAFNTPQILMLSGIGPAYELRKNNIRVMADVPGVGKNLQDKLEASINYQMQDDWKFFEQGCTFLQDFPNTPDPCFQAFLEGKASVYSTTGVIIAAQRISSQNSQNPQCPDVYIQLSPSLFTGYFDGWVPRSFSQPNVLTFNTATAVSGAGSITLNSNNPFDQPNIDFNGYNDEDLERIAETISELRGLMLFLNGQGIISNMELAPGPGVVSLEALKDWVRLNGWGHHACCTAKIGAYSDPYAVLDGQLRVRKVKNLRVVDNSAFPKNPGFFPSVPIMMLAEKASEDIIKAAMYVHGIFEGGIYCDNAYH